MSTVIKNYCDRCKSEIVDESLHLTNSLWGEHQKICIDLCRKCTKDFKKFIRSVSKD